MDVRLRVLPVILAVLSIVLVLATAGRADAHSELVSSTPENGARLSTMPGEVTLVFNENIDPNFAQVVVADAGEIAHPVTPAVSGAQVTAAVPEGLPQGEVHVRYRVVSADGHPVSGEVVFTAGSPAATQPAGASPTSSAAPSAAAPTAPGAVEEDASTTWMYALTGFAALLIIGGGLAILIASRRR